MDRSNVMYIPSHYSLYSYLTSENRKILISVVVIIVEVEIIEPQISICIRIEAGIHITFHTIKKVEVVHQLVKYVASTTLYEDSPISIGMRIDGASGALTTDVASEGHSHATSR